MKKLILFACIVFQLFFSTSCLRNPGPGSSGRVSSLSNVTGAAGEVLVVLDNTMWKGEAGNILREALEQEYPALPQPEPLFDVIHITSGAFDTMFKGHRSIIVIDVSPQNTTPQIKYSENIWAQPQILISINVPDNKSLIKLLQDNKDRLVYNLLIYDRKRIADVYNSSKDVAIKNMLSKFHVSLAVPRGYNVDLDKEDFILTSIESSKTSQVIFIYRYPYYGKNDISSKNLIEKRNEFLKKYTGGHREGSYMTTAKLFPPQVFDLVKGTKNYVEIRGLWELNKGFMGGPFISHSTVDEARKEVITVEGYVYNPNDKKRNLMRQIEAIVYSFEVVE